MVFQSLPTNTFFAHHQGKRWETKQPSMVAAQNQESCPEVASLNSACLAKEKGLQMGSVKMGPTNYPSLVSFDAETYVLGHPSNPETFGNEMGRENQTASHEAP